MKKIFFAFALILISTVASAQERIVTVTQDINFTVPGDGQVNEILIPLNYTYKDQVTLSKIKSSGGDDGQFITKDKPGIIAVSTHLKIYRQANAGTVGKIKAGNKYKLFLPKKYAARDAYDSDRNDFVLENINDSSERFFIFAYPVKKVNLSRYGDLLDKNGYQKTGIWYFGLEFYSPRLQDAMAALKSAGMQVEGGQDIIEL